MPLSQQWAVTPDGEVPLEADWDNTGQRIRNTGVAEVGTEPASPITGMLWLDTSVSPSSGQLGLSVAIVTKTAGYTAADSDCVILCDATSAAFTITLPAAGNNSGRIYHIKKIDSSANGVTIDADLVETVDGDTTKILSSQHDAAMIISDASNWYII